MSERPPRIHCQTYRQMAVLKIVLDKMKRKLAAKGESQLVIPLRRAPQHGKDGKDE